MNTGHPGSVCTLHSDSPRETLPRLTRLALRNPHAPRQEAVAAEVARTVDLVIHLAVHAVDGARRRRLESIGYVAGVEAGQPVVDELVRADAGGGWRRVGSPASMPARVLDKLAASGFGIDLLDGLDG